MRKSELEIKTVIKMGKATRDLISNIREETKCEIDMIKRGNCCTDAFLWQKKLNNIFDIYAFYLGIIDGKIIHAVNDITLGKNTNDKDMVNKAKESIEDLKYGERLYVEASFSEKIQDELSIKSIKEIISVIPILDNIKSIYDIVKNGDTQLNIYLHFINAYGSGLEMSNQIQFALIKEKFKYYDKIINAEYDKNVELIGKVKVKSK